jgi:hypothetical protein
VASYGGPNGLTKRVDGGASGSYVAFSLSSFSFLFHGRTPGEPAVAL